jgi:hypothetical protein
VPLVPLACCWVIAALAHARVTDGFMWLVFVCAAILGVLELVDRAIHSLELWDARQGRKR